MQGLHTPLTEERRPLSSLEPDGESTEGDSPREETGNQNYVLSGPRHFCTPHSSVFLLNSPIKFSQKSHHNHLSEGAPPPSPPSFSGKEHHSQSGLTLCGRCTQAGRALCVEANDSLLPSSFHHVSPAYQTILHPRLLVRGAEGVLNEEANIGALAHQVKSRVVTFSL